MSIVDTHRDSCTDRFIQQFPNIWLHLFMIGEKEEVKSMVTQNLWVIHIQLDRWLVFIQMAVCTNTHWHHMTFMAVVPCQTWNAKSHKSQLQRLLVRLIYTPIVPELYLPAFPRKTIETVRDAPCSCKCCSPSTDHEYNHHQICHCWKFPGLQACTVLCNEWDSQHYLR